MTGKRKCEYKDGRKPVAEYDPSSGLCIFCNGNGEEEEGVDCGKLLTDKDRQIYVHKYCLLFASGLPQAGEDTEGIEGFFVTDILKEYKRGRRLTCFYCHKKITTIGCSLSVCKRGFHFNCGAKNEALFCFFGAFSAYCKSHRPQQDVKVAESDPATVTCPICFEDVEVRVSNHTLKTPCCNNTWFHRNCVQRQALSAGYFFRCAICNNQDQFQDEMKKFGIYVPEHDASWEMEDNAFQELYWRHDKCDIDPCLCPKGNKFNKASSKWELILCDICGSSGCHLACGGLKSINQDWACAMCNAMMSTATAVSCPSSASPQKSPTKTGQTTRTAMKLMGKHPRTPLSSQSFRKKTASSPFSSLKHPSSPEEKASWAQDSSAGPRGNRRRKSFNPPDLIGSCGHCQPSTSKQGLEDAHHRRVKKRKLTCCTKENDLGYSELKYGPRTTLRMSMRPRKTALLQRSPVNTPIQVYSIADHTKEQSSKHVEKFSQAETISAPTLDTAVSSHSENLSTVCNAEEFGSSQKVLATRKSTKVVVSDSLDEELSSCSSEMTANGVLLNASMQISPKDSLVTSHPQSTDSFGLETRSLPHTWKKSQNATVTRPVEDEPLSCLAAKLASQASSQMLAMPNETGNKDTRSSQQQDDTPDEKSTGSQLVTDDPDVLNPPSTTKDSCSQILAKETCKSDPERHSTMIQALASDPLPSRLQSHVSGCLGETDALTGVPKEDEENTSHITTGKADRGNNLKQANSATESPNKVMLPLDDGSKSIEAAGDVHVNSASTTVEESPLSAVPTDNPTEDKEDEKGAISLPLTEDKVLTPNKSPSYPKNDFSFEESPGNVSGCSATLFALFDNTEDVCTSPSVFALPSIKKPRVGTEPHGDTTPCRLPHSSQYCERSRQQCSPCTLSPPYLSPEKYPSPDHSIPSPSDLPQGHPDNSAQQSVDAVGDKINLARPQSAETPIKGQVKVGIDQPPKKSSFIFDGRELKPELCPASFLEDKTSTSQSVESLQRVSTPLMLLETINVEEGQVHSDCTQESDKTCESPSNMPQLLNANTSCQIVSADHQADQPLGRKETDRPRRRKKHRKTSKSALAYPVIGTGRYSSKPKCRGQVAARSKKAVGSPLKGQVKVGVNQSPKKSSYIFDDIKDLKPELRPAPFLENDKTSTSQSVESLQREVDGSRRRRKYRKTSKSALAYPVFGTGRYSSKPKCRGQVARRSQKAVGSPLKGQVKDGVNQSPKKSSYNFDDIKDLKPELRPAPFLEDDNTSTLQSVESLKREADRSRRRKKCRKTSKSALAYPVIGAGRYSSKPKCRGQVARRSQKAVGSPLKGQVKDGVNQSPKKSSYIFDDIKDLKPELCPAPFLEDDKTSTLQSVKSLQREADRSRRCKKHRKTSKSALAYPVIGTGRYSSKPKCRGQVARRSSLEDGQRQRRISLGTCQLRLSRNGNRMADSQGVVRLSTGMLLRRRISSNKESLLSHKTETADGVPAWSKHSPWDESFSAQDRDRGSEIPRGRQSTGKLLRRNYMRYHILNLQDSAPPEGEREIGGGKPRSVLDDQVQETLQQPDPIPGGTTEANTTLHEKVSTLSGNEIGGDISTEEPASMCQTLSSDTGNSPDSGISQDFGCYLEDALKNPGSTAPKISEPVLVNLMEEVYSDSKENVDQHIAIASSASTLESDASSNITPENKNCPSETNQSETVSVSVLPTESMSFEPVKTDISPKSQIVQVSSGTASPSTSVCSSHSTPKDIKIPQTDCSDLNSSTSHIPPSGDNSFLTSSPQMNLNRNPSPQASIANRLPGTPPTKPTQIEPSLTFSGKEKVSSPGICDSSAKPMSCPGKFQSGREGKSLDMSQRSLRKRSSQKQCSRARANLFDTREDLGRLHKRPRIATSTRPVLPLVSGNDESDTCTSRYRTRIYVSNSPKSQQNPMLTSAESPERPWLLRSKTIKGPNALHVESTSHLPSQSSGKSCTSLARNATPDSSLQARVYRSADVGERKSHLPNLPNVRSLWKQEECRSPKTPKVESQGFTSQTSLIHVPSCSKKGANSSSESASPLCSPLPSSLCNSSQKKPRIYRSLLPKSASKRHSPLKTDASSTVLLEKKSTKPRSIEPEKGSLEYLDSPSGALDFLPNSRSDRKRTSSPKLPQEGDIINKTTKGRVQLFRS